MAHNYVTLKFVLKTWIHKKYRGNAITMSTKDKINAENIHFRFEVLGSCWKYEYGHGHDEL